MWGRKALVLAMTSAALATVLITFSVQEASAPAESVVERGPFVVYGPSDQHVIDVAVSGYYQQLDALFSDLAVQKAKQEAAIKAAATPVTKATPNYDPGDGSRWDQLARCETGGNWAANTGNGFGGGLQFMHQRSYSTWLSFGGGEFAPNPWDATREQQIVIAEKVLASSGWRAWPGCSKRFNWL